MGAGLEVELKLHAETDAPLQALARIERLGLAELGPARVVDEVDRYLDAPGGPLAAVRWACRLRTREGRTLVSLKGPAQHPAGDGLHRRPELEGPAGAGLDPGAWPPSEARDLLTRLAGSGPLAERFTLRQRRTERDVLVAGRRIGTLSLDRVAVTGADGTEAGSFRAVELELAGSDSDPAPIFESLRAHPGLVPDPQTKLERALALLGVEGG